MKLNEAQIAASLGETHTVYGQSGNVNIIHTVGISWFDEGLFAKHADKKYIQNRLYLLF